MILNQEIFKVGTNVFLFGLTKHMTGTILSIADDKKSVVLANAAWLSSVGRLSDFFKTGSPERCEMYPHPFQVNLDAFTGITEIKTIPKETK